MRGLALIVGLAAVLSGCAPEQGDPLRPADAAVPVTDAPALRVPQSPGDAPHIYMSLQDDGAQAVSIIFAIDAARNNTPSDDPAIRLTPEGGKCNPQQLRRYDFPAATGQRPIFGPDEAVAGLTAKELPSFIAMAVTSEMRSSRNSSTPGAAAYAVRRSRAAARM